MPTDVPRKGRKVPAPPLGVPPQVGRREAAEARHPGFVRDGRFTAGAYTVPRFDFERCPICLRPDDLTDEHVPMKSLGGKVMTRTCSDCNNRLGSVSEAALRSVVAGEVIVEAARQGADGFRGFRKATVALRQAPSAIPEMHVTSGDNELLAAISSGEPLAVRYRLFDPFPSGIAILKYAYLAACIWLREIPITEEAESIRLVLMAIRDGEELPEDVCEAISGLIHILVLVENPSHDLGSIVLVEPTTVHSGWGFVLGQRLRCPWPFSDVQPTDRRDA
nr:HNH endonuclease [Leucobacter edaphi]